MVRLSGPTVVAGAVGVAAALCWSCAPPAAVVDAPGEVAATVVFPDPAEALGLELGAAAAELTFVFALAVGALCATASDDPASTKKLVAITAAALKSLFMKNLPPGPCPSKSTAVQPVDTTSV
jgi:hypothetical protein